MPDALRAAGRRVVAAWVSTRPNWVEEVDRAVRVLDEALRQPEPAQEPVAVFDERMGRPVLLSGAPMLKDEQPLYTAPPQRPPLTDEEIEDIFKHLCSTVGASYKTMARAIERKVRGE